MKKIRIIVCAVIIVIIAAVVIINVNNNKSNNEYQLEKIDKYSYFKLYENGKYGVIDEQGNTIIEATYDVLNIPNPTKAVFICYSDYNPTTEEYKTIVLNNKKQEILTQFEEVLPIMCERSISNIPFEKSVLQYKENGKYGLIDYAGNKITNAIYDEIESLEYREGCFKVKQEDKYGIINLKGKDIVKIAYEDIKSDEYYTKNNGYMEAGFIVQIKTDDGYRYGYIDHKGKTIVKTEYNDLERIIEIDDKENIYLLSSKNGKIGVLKNGKNLIENAYELVDYNKSSNLFVVRKNSKQGAISIDGSIIIPVEYDSVVCTGSRITTVRGENVEIYNTKGERQDLKYDNMAETENENYIITINDDSKFGVISQNGQVLVQNEYDNLTYAFDTYFIATQNSKVGVIEINSGVVVNFEYDIVQKVKDKRAIQAIVSATNTIDMFNNKMEKQLSIRNANLYTFDNYLKLISENDMAYLDNDGNLISNKEVLQGNKLFAYTNNDKWGFVDSNNGIVVDAKYDLVTELNKYGYAGIKINNKWGVIDQTGRVIVEPTYTIDWDDPEFIDKYYKSNLGYGFEYYTAESK